MKKNSAPTQNNSQSTLKEISIDQIRSINCGGGRTGKVYPKVEFDLLSATSSRS
jgi:hypothetical protein